MSTDLIRKASIEELCAHRDRALELVERAIDLVKTANETATKAAPTQSVSDAFVGVSSYRNKFNPKLEDFRKQIDAACWRHLLGVSGLEQLMSASQRDAFQKSLYDNPPEFTVENVYATFADKVTNSGTIFNQSVVDVFERLPPSYKTNNRFRFDDKIIFVAGYSDYSKNWLTRASGGYEVQPIIKDLDRIMHILDRTPHNTDASAFCSIAMSEGKTECATEYFYFKWFKKGTVHIRFNRSDLVREMNRILASHYGDAIANAA